LGVFIWKQVRVSTTSSTGSPRFIAPHSGFPLIEVELVSTTPDIAKTGTSENPSHLIEIVSQRLSQTEVTTLVDGRYLDHDTLS
jgi:hypothetical protein